MSNGLELYQDQLHFLEKYLNHSCSSDCVTLPQHIITNPTYIIDGDVLVYAFIRIFKSEDNISCSNILSKDGYEELEALKWSVHTINKDPSIMGNITLGLVVVDTCGLASLTKDTVSSILDRRFMLPGNLNLKDKRVLGVVGGTHLSDAEAIETGVRVVSQDIPTVSFPQGIRRLS